MVTLHTKAWRQICHRSQLNRGQIFPPVSLLVLISVANFPPVSSIPAANLLPVSTTPVATGINTGGKLANSVNDTGGKQWELIREKNQKQKKIS
jgi:hypothetical protein